MRMEVKGTFRKTLKHLKDQNMMFTVREEREGGVRETNEPSF